MKTKNDKKQKQAQPADMPEVLTFDHNHKPVRVEMIDGDPWFVAKDVCEVLGISNSRDAVVRLDDDEKATSVLPTQFGSKEMNLVNESGLYALIFQSRKPEAKVFRKWVTSELLPVVRKTGKYAPGAVENDCPYTRFDLFPVEMPPGSCLATSEWVLDMMNKVCRVEDSRLRIEMADTLTFVKRF